jgi:hypothetical protein
LAENGGLQIKSPLQMPLRVLYKALFFMYGVPCFLFAWTLPAR